MAGMRFLQRVAGENLRYSLKGLDIWGRLSIEVDGHLKRKRTVSHEGFFRHIQLGKNFMADPEPVGGVVYTIWLGNT